MPKTLSELRVSRGLIRSQVAAALGIAEMTVWNWENGKRYPSRHLLRRLANFYGVTLDELDGLLPKSDAS